MWIIPCLQIPIRQHRGQEVALNQNNYRGLQINLSGVGFWLVLFGAVWLIGSIGLVWVLKSLLILIGLLLITPVVAVLVFQWWLRRNLVEGECPVCQYDLAGLNGMQLRCPSCSEPLKIEHKHFTRLTPPGTVDVKAIEVEVQQLDD